MIGERDQLWAEFDSLGTVEIRKRLGAQQYGEQKVKLAREWLAHQESLQSSAENAASLAEARSANDLARAANSLAEQANSVAEISAISAARSVKKAWTANIIAIVAAAIAAIAMYLSYIGGNNAKSQNIPKNETQTQAH